MQFAKLAIATSIALLLSACNRPEITVTVKWPAKLQSMTYGASATSASTTSTSAVDISGSIASADSNVTLDAAAMTIDVSSSTVGFPSSGTTTLRIVSNSGALIGSRSFGWSRSGGMLYFSDPSAINSWLQSSGAPLATSRIDYALDNLNVAITEGENYVAATVEMYSEPVASGSSSYNTGGGGSGCDGPFYCETP